MIRIGCDVADCEDVFEAVDGERGGGLDRAVFFEGEGWVGAKVGGGGGDADAEDDEVGGEGGAVFEFDGADGVRVGFGGEGRVDGGGEMELDAGFGERGLDYLADAGAEDAFERDGFHADYAHGVLFGEGVADFHADEGGADYDYFSVLFGANGAEDGLGRRGWSGG